MRCVTVDSFDAWRDAARELVRHNVPPSEVHWLAPEQAGLFDDHRQAEPVGDGEPSGSKEPHAVREPHAAKESLANLKCPVGLSGCEESPAFTVPKRFLSMARLAACYIEKAQPTRKWALLYSLLWRINKQHSAVLSLQADSEVQAVQLMARSVSRDQHKMKAFVRFQTSLAAEDSPSEVEYFTAWFEPDHAIVKSTANFFVKRFAGMSWSILTPVGCAHWDQCALKFSPGTTRPELQPDDYEVFWKAYYCNIFNPARLKEKAMMSEMPKKFWKHLPEAQCIKSLTSGAAASMAAMIDNPLTDSERVRSKSAAVESVQDGLRSTNRQ